MTTAFNLIKQNLKFIELDDWDGFYKALNEPDMPNKGLIGTVTKIIIDSDVDPLSYLEYIPTRYLAGSDIKYFKPKHFQLTDIHPIAFLQCRNLKEVDFTQTSIKSIGHNCFKFSSIQIIRLPKTITYIHDSAFSDCTKLKQVYINCSREEFTHTECLYSLPTSCDVIFNDQTIKGLI